MTLNELAQIEAAGSKTLISALPEEKQKSLFDKMREAIGPMSDDEFEELDARTERAYRFMKEVELELKHATEVWEKLNAQRGEMINARLAKEKGTQ